MHKQKIETDKATGTRSATEMATAAERMAGTIPGDVPGEAGADQHGRASAPGQQGVDVRAAEWLRRLSTLEKLDEGAGSEVFVDETTGLVYKLLRKSPNMGRIGEGFIPGRVYEAGKRICASFWGVLP